MKNLIFRFKETRVSVIIWMILSLMTILKASYSQNMADFTGKWILNKSQSSSLLTQVASSTIIISQDKQTIIMDVTITPENQKPINRTEKYVLNTSVKNKTTKPEEKSIQITSQLAPDGQSFSITETISYTQNGILKELQRVSVYSLSKDGKTLTIKSDDTLPESSTTPENLRHETRVYNKSI